VYNPISDGTLPGVGWETAYPGCDDLLDWIPAPAPDPDPGFAGMTMRSQEAPG